MTKAKDYFLKIFTDKIVGIAIVLIIQLILLELFDTSPTKFIKQLWFSTFHSFNGYRPLIIETLITLNRFLIGFSFAIITAIPLGILLGRNKLINNIFKIPIETLRPIPSAIIIPLLIMLIGIGEGMKYLVVWYGAFWPLLIFTKESSNNIDPILIQTGEIFHLSKKEIMKELVLPSTLPHIISGAKAAISIGLLLAITVEMIAGGKTSGIGYFILDSERQYDYSGFFSGVLIIGIVGYLMNLGIEKMEKLLLSKKYSYLKPIGHDDSNLSSFFNIFPKKRSIIKKKIAINKSISEQIINNHLEIPFKREVFVNNNIYPNSDIHIAVHYVDREVQDRYALMHSHKFDEINLIIGNEMNEPLKYEIMSDKEVMIVESPCSVYIPKGVSHTANAIGGKGIFICIIKDGDI
jgi:ABC-type nitrate/sulfonate/bicarbonate transport system permease component